MTHWWIPLPANQLIYSHFSTWCKVSSLIITDKLSASCYNNLLWHIYDWKLWTILYHFKIISMTKIYWPLYLDLFARLSSPGLDLGKLKMHITCDRIIFISNATCQLSIIPVAYFCAATSSNLEYRKHPKWISLNGTEVSELLWN